ncbi:hypothetical protein [Kiloniella antarctica]|uniref:Uncharacterized protein n=1 Tax=Kiloniella antarctica TaxID=1550907 RepID=A0ABW5BIY9_9PROT
MEKFKTSQAISRLSIILAIIVPLIFISVVMLKNQQVPAGFEIIKLGGIMLAIALVVWLSVRITALLSNILINWIDKLLARDKQKNKPQQDKNQGENNKFQPKIIDAEIVEEEISDGVWQKGSSGDTSDNNSGNALGKFEPDWAKATSDPHLALSNPNSKDAGSEKRKKIIGPPSRLSKTIMVVLVFSILFLLISNLMTDIWLTLLAPIPGLWAIISLWRIWDPKNNSSKESIPAEDQKHS